MTDREIIRSWWGALSLKGKAAVVGVAILLLLFFAGIGARGWEHFRAWRFDKRDAERERLIAEKDQQIQALIRQAEIAEAKAAVAGQKAETLEALTKQHGARAEAAARKVEEAFDAFENDRAITGADVPDAVRRERICAKRKELGYPC